MLWTYVLVSGGHEPQQINDEIELLFNNMESLILIFIDD